MRKAHPELKVTVSPDCGNAPKKLFLKAFNVAFVKGDSEFILENVSDDIVWTIVGNKRIQGKADFESSLKNMKEARTVALTLHTIITHGKEGAVSGSMIMENGKHYDFCDVYEFSSAKGSTLKSITSYIINVTP